MNKIYRFLASVVVAVALAAPLSSAQALGLSDKAGLQAAMQQHVARQTVDGRYLYFDTKTAQVRTLHPVTAHPMIMQLGEQFVLCFDFADEQGKKVEVDFYLARKGETFFVFHAAIESRNILVALMDAGKVTPVD
jgi:hypothetical protein